MLNRIFRLVDVKRIEMTLSELIVTSDDVLVKPDYLSICAADQRYYLGKRNKAVMKQKLPMALVHEAIGTLVYDPLEQITRGTKVVLIPNIPALDDGRKGNYREGSSFCSSGTDGFMQDIFAAPRDRLVVLPDNASFTFVLSELVSVAFNAVDAFLRCCHTEKKRIGVWGDGSVGFVMALILKHTFPDSQIVIFGKNLRKLQHFSFAQETYLIDSVSNKVRLDHCFECVGGRGSEAAIAQILELIRPQGCIALLGVSDNFISINTRKVLEKGLLLFGNSRSEKCDFEKAVHLIHSRPSCEQYLKTIISQVIDITKEDDISYAFEQDLLNDFKTVIKWQI